MAKLNGWMPLDTAPRGGVRFLFVTSGGFVGIGQFFSTANVFGADSFGGGRDTDPVGWQPLPSGDWHDGKA